ncbi:MAG TPA: PD-(D/E)XK nuclease family protein [Limnochordales bacterium]
MQAGGSVQAPVVEVLVRWCHERRLEPVTVVAPSWEAGMQVARRVAERLEGRACLGLQAVPVEALVERLGGPALAEAGVRRLPPWGLEWLAERAARSVEGYYAGVVERPGFARALAQTVALLRQHGVPPERLEQAASASAPAERDRWRALARIYRLVSESLAPAGPWHSDGSWADGAAVWWAAIRETREGRAPERLGGSTVVLWLPPEPFAPQHLWYRLEEALAHEASGLHLVRHPLDPEPLRPRAGEVRLVAASDEVREAELAVAALLEAAREGVPFWRMAVIVRSDAGAWSLVADAARRAGLRPYVPGAMRPVDSPYGRALVRWLRLLEEELPPAAVMAWLAESPVRPERFGIEAGRWQPGAWEGLAMRAGLVSGLAAWEERLQSAGDAVGDDPRWPDLERAARAVLDEARGFPEAGDWREMSQACRAFVERTMVPHPEREALLDQLERLEALDEVAAGGPVSRLRLRQAVEALLGAPSGSEGRFEQGGPAVLTGPHAMGCSFDTVVVVGLNDPGWPARHRATAGPLLGESDMERLGLAGAGLRGAWEARREWRLFAAAVASAERRLVASRARAEALTGRSRVDSPYLAPLRAWTPAGDSRADGWTREILDAAGFDVQLARRRRRDAEPYLKRRYPLAARGAMARRARWSRRLTEWDGLVGADGTLPATLVISPTALESYARCPRRFFFERRLGVMPPEDPEASEGLQGRALGSVAHRALEIFFTRWIQERTANAAAQGQQAEWQRWLDEAVSQAVREQAAAVASMPGLARLQQEAVADALRQFLMAETERLEQDGWRPEALERSVEAELTFDEGLVVRLPNRLDRVDLRRDPATGRPVAARVVDYKTSRSAPDPTRLDGGTSLQLPLYLLAAARYAELPVEACEAERVALREDGSIDRATLPGIRWAAMESSLRLAVGTLARLILEGCFPGAPVTGRECENCPFRAICGPETWRQARRKADEAPLQKLAAVREQAK